MYANNAREVGDRKHGSLLEWLHIRIIHIYTRKLLLASRDSSLGEGSMKDVFMQMLMRIRVASCVIPGYSRIDLIRKKQLRFLAADNIHETRKLKYHAVLK